MRAAAALGLHGYVHQIVGICRIANKQPFLNFHLRLANSQTRFTTAFVISSLILHFAF
jgi:hypothetical protein